MTGLKLTLIGVPLKMLYPWVSSSSLCADRARVSHTDMFSFFFFFFFFFFKEIYLKLLLWKLWAKYLTLSRFALLNCVSLFSFFFFHFALYTYFRVLKFVSSLQLYSRSHNYTLSWRIYWYSSGWWWQWHTGAQFICLYHYPLTIACFLAQRHTESSHVCFLKMRKTAGLFVNRKGSKTKI